MITYFNTENESVIGKPKDSPELQSLYDVQYSMCLNISYLLPNWFAQLFQGQDSTCGENHQLRLVKKAVSINSVRAGPVSYLCFGALEIKVGDQNT